jgi:hypothetical protein
MITIRPITYDQIPTRSLFNETFLYSSEVPTSREERFLAIMTSIDRSEMVLLRKQL